MTPTHDDPPSYNDWDDDPDAPQECDLTGDDDDTPTVPCPSCAKLIPDFVDRCPHCGDWIIQTSGSPTRRSPWLIIAALVALAGFVAWYVL